MLNEYGRKCRPLPAKLESRKRKHAARRERPQQRAHTVHAGERHELGAAAEVGDGRIRGVARVWHHHKIAVSLAVLGSLSARGAPEPPPLAKLTLPSFQNGETRVVGVRDAMARRYGSRGAGQVGCGETGECCGGRCRAGILFPSLAGLPPAALWYQYKCALARSSMPQARAPVGDGACLANGLPRTLVVRAFDHCEYVLEHMCGRKLRAGSRKLGLGCARAREQQPGFGRHYRESVARAQSRTRTVTGRVATSAGTVACSICI